jgi:hypothetical protein
MADNTYWLTFRIHDDATSDHRRDKLYETINNLSSKWWIEPTSFVAFSSEQSADTIAAKVKASFNPAIDMALLGMTDFKTARLIGKSDDRDIYELIPFLKKV